MGITPDIELEMKGDNKEYICPSCTSVTTLVNSASMGPPTTSVISPCGPCVDFIGEIKMVQLLQVDMGCFRGCGSLET